SRTSTTASASRRSHAAFGVTQPHRFLQPVPLALDLGLSLTNRVRGPMCLTDSVHFFAGTLLPGSSQENPFVNLGARPEAIDHGTYLSLTPLSAITTDNWQRTS